MMRSINQHGDNTLSDSLVVALSILAQCYRYIPVPVL
jgi:hypothetical protein